MTKEQLHILQHSLGLDEYGLVGYFRDGKRHYGFMPNRNHFCAGGSDEDACRELVALGYMKTWPHANERGEVPGYPYYNCSVTDEGKAAVRRESPAPPKVSRSKQRYRDFLHSGAGDCGINFGEWLKMPKASR